MSSTDRQPRFNPQDEIACKCIGILMLAAKQLEEARRDAELPDSETEAVCIRASKAYGELIKLCSRLFPAPMEMERQVLEFGKKLGFEIKQQYIQRGSTAKQ